VADFGGKLVQISINFTMFFKAISIYIEKIDTGRNRLAKEPHAARAL